jgi:hypothetical protein
LVDESTKRDSPLVESHANVQLAKNRKQRNYKSTLAGDSDHEGGTGSTVPVDKPAQETGPDESETMDNGANQHNSTSNDENIHHGKPIKKKRQWRHNKLGRVGVDLPPSLPCPACALSFRTKGARTAHLRTQHPHWRPLKCAHCTQRFSMAADRAAHQATHTAGGSYTCGECGKRTAHQANMFIHVGGVHDGGCHLCSPARPPASNTNAFSEQRRPGRKKIVPTQLSAAVIVKTKRRQ